MAANIPAVAHTLLACPQCGEQFSGEGATLRCRSGHCFDYSSRGYVTLLTGKGRSSPGDNRAQLDARQSLFATGLFDQVHQGLADLSRQYCPPNLRVVADVGCGHGTYGGIVAQASPTDTPWVVGIDISALAARACARLPRWISVVADVWKPWPLRDQIVDASVIAFAPKNYEQLTRVTAPGGVVFIVVPTSEHLASLRAITPLLHVPSGKAEAVSEELGRSWEVVRTQRIHTTVTCSAEAVKNVVMMGPAGARSQVEDMNLAELPPGGISTDVSVDIVVAMKR